MSFIGKSPYPFPKLFMVNSLNVPACFMKCFQRKVQAFNRKKHQNLKKISDKLKLGQDIPNVVRYHQKKIPVNRTPTLPAIWHPRGKTGVKMVNKRTRPIEDDLKKLKIWISSLFHTRNLIVAFIFGILQVLTLFGAPQGSNGVKTVKKWPSPYI